jgi:hypothetical protein
MDPKIIEDCKIIVNTPQYWAPLSKYMNEILGEEINRLVYADTLERIKEVQGSIKTIRRLLDLPNVVSRLEKESSHR